MPALLVAERMMGMSSQRLLHVLCMLGIAWLQEWTILVHTLSHLILPVNAVRQAFFQMVKLSFRDVFAVWLRLCGASHWRAQRWFDFLAQLSRLPTFAFG